METTIKELQKVAKENGFFLCPESLWNRMGNVIDYRDSEIKRLKLSRDNWKNKYKKIKND